jgi:hypothetical protein
MTTQDIANDLVALCREGKFAESGEKYWAPDVVSVEAGGPEGMDPVNHDVHSVEVEGPYCNGDQFVVRFKMDLTPKGGQRMTMDEMAVYTLKAGKIAEERFFYGG